MAASAAKGVWQRCARELAGSSCRRAPSAVAGEAAIPTAAAAVVKASPLNPKSSSPGDSIGIRSEQPKLLSSFSWRRAGGAAAAGATRSSSGHVHCHERLSSLGFLSGSSSSSKRFASLKQFSRPYAMQFSSGSAEEQTGSENAPVETVTVVETVVVGADPSTELEFAPDNESTPSTPLVQAIQSQEAEDVSSSSTHHQQLRDVFAEAGAPDAVSESDQRVIQPGRIYIGGLPFGMKGDELRDGLRELCGQYGVVMDVSLAQHRNQSKKSILAGKHRGFAFVMMENSEQAQEVIEKVNGTTVWGRVLLVSYGLKKVEPEPTDRLDSTLNTATRCKVFVGNLFEGTSRFDLVNKFQQYGTVVDVKLITELHSQRSRGFGFVTFAEEGQAVRAVLDTDGSILNGAVMRVNIAKYPQGY